MLGRPDDLILLDQWRAGRLARTTRITCAGKTDGAGAQAVAVMSALAFAHAAGIGYLHTPFESIAHAIGDQGDWTRSWESFFGLGRGEEATGDRPRRIVGLKEYLKTPALWRQEGMVVRAGHFQGFCNSDPDAYRGILPVLRSKYDASSKSALLPDGYDRTLLNVAVHIRRGDVSRDDAEPTVAGRFTEPAAILRTLGLCIGVLDSLGVRHRVRVYSQGRDEEFGEFADLGCALYLSRDPFTTFHGLVAADVLIMAKSAFSFAAALLSDAITLYEPFPTRPLSGWIVRDGEGSLDAAALRMQVAERIGQTE